MRPTYKSLLRRSSLASAKRKVTMRSARIGFSYRVALQATLGVTSVLPDIMAPSTALLPMGTPSRSSPLPPTHLSTCGAPIPTSSPTRCRSAVTTTIQTVMSLHLGLHKACKTSKTPITSLLHPNRSLLLLATLAHSEVVAGSCLFL